jgi:two-component system, response regulator YesN
MIFKVGVITVYQVMVVEDEQWIRKAMVKMIEKMDSYKVVAEVGNGEEALELIYEVWPTIIITDIKMPKKDGLWLAREIKERKLPIVPIIVTGYDQFEYAQQALRYGVSDFLLKPVVEEEVYKALDSSIDRLKYHLGMHDYLKNIQAFINQLQDNPLNSPLTKQMNLVNLLFEDSKLTIAERNVLLKIFSGKLNDLIKNLVPNFQPLKLTDIGQEEVSNHFQQLLEQWMNVSNKTSDTNVQTIIKNACEYICDHYYKDITLNDITDYLNISISHFSFLFKKSTGKTFSNYLNSVRIKKAKELLAENDLKVYQIAEMVGYLSPTHFNRVFKEMNGYTPNEYRKFMNL